MRHDEGSTEVVKNNSDDDDQVHLRSIRCIDVGFDDGCTIRKNTKQQYTEICVLCALDRAGQGRDSREELVREWQGRRVSLGSGNDGGSGSAESGGVWVVEVVEELDKVKEKQQARQDRTGLGTGAGLLGSKWLAGLGFKPAWGGLAGRKRLGGCF